MLEFEAGSERFRLDEFLARELTEVSVTRLRRMIADGEVIVNGRTSLKGRRLEAGDMIKVLPESIEVSSATPEDIPLDILFEDDDLIAINKPVGLLSHPSNSIKSGTLTNALAFHFQESCGRPIRAGLVHRLDRNTSGVIVVAKALRAQQILARAFRDRRIRKTYTAILSGVVETDSGRIDAPIGSDPDTWPHWQILESGRTAITDYRVLRRFTAHSLVEFTPQTGRTHQLRIHSALLGHSIVGDPVYSNAPDSVAERFGLTHHLLHAQKLCFSHPTQGYEMELEAPPPEFWRTILEEL